MTLSDIPGRGSARPLAAIATAFVVVMAASLAGCALGDGVDVPTDTAENADIGSVFRAVTNDQPVSDPTSRVRMGTE